MPARNEAEARQAGDRTLPGRLATLIVNEETGTLNSKWRTLKNDSEVRPTGMGHNRNRDNGQCEDHDKADAKMMLAAKIAMGS